MKNTFYVAAFLVSSLFSTVSADDWMLRFGAAQVSPNDESGPVLGNDGVAVGSDTQLGISITYMFDKEWGLEVLGASPFSHDISGTGDLAGVPIGTTKHLPPTISVLYNMGDSDLMYHLGVGVNYTKFYEDYSSPEIRAALGASVDLDLSASTGLAFKAGFDMPLSDNWYFSGGLYYMMLDTDADVFVNGAKATTVAVDIDPWVVMIGLGMSF